VSTVRTGTLRPAGSGQPDIFLPVFLRDGGSGMALRGLPDAVVASGFIPSFHGGSESGSYRTKGPESGGQSGTLRPHTLRPWGSPRGRCAVYTEGVTLQLLPTVHDLPPMWDGRVVEWHEWVAGSAFFACPKPKPERCDSCGSVEYPSWCVGVVHPLPGDTFTDRIERRTRSGYVYLTDHVVTFPAWPILRLSATRCPTCGHDHVIDMDDWSEWCLEASDYLDGGSTPSP